VVELVQTLKRPLLVLAAAGLVGALASSAALAVPGHGRFGARVTGPGVLGAWPGFPGPGFGGVLGGALGAGPGFRDGHGGPGGLAAVDVLTPAASYLGVSVATLAADLKGGKTLAEEATAKDKTAAGLIDAIVAAEKTVLDNEKAAGWLTDAQETSLSSSLSDGITRLVNNGPSIPAAARTKPGLLEAAATYLGISLATLQSDLRSGKTLAEEATANGKTVDGLVSALTAQAKSNLDAAAAAGTITQAQESSRLAEITERVTNLVNNAKLGAPPMMQMQALFRR